MKTLRLLIYLTCLTLFISACSKGDDEGDAPMTTEDTFREKGLYAALSGQWEVVRSKEDKDSEFIDVIPTAKTIYRQDSLVGIIYGTNQRTAYRISYNTDSSMYKWYSAESDKWSLPIFCGFSGNTVKLSESADFSGKVSEIRKIE